MASNLLKTYTFPHAESRIKDESIGATVRDLTLPLHVPLFPIRAAKGPVNVIEWYTGADAITEFGDETFDQFSRFYRGEQIFLSNAILPNQGSLIVRLADPDAKKATAVIECHLTAGVSIPQYERDAKGGFVFDTSGKKIPLLDSAQNPVTEAGVKLRYVVRPMLDTEVSGKIQPKTVTSGSETTVIYPLVDVVYRSPGVFGNKAGFKLCFDYTTQDSDINDQTNSVIYTLYPVEQPYDSDTAEPIYDVYSNPYCQFVVKPNQVDANTARRVSVTDIIKNNYTTTTGFLDNILPYTTNFYADNFKTIGDAIKAVEINSADITDGWMVDILTCLDMDGYPYYHAEIDTTGTGYTTMNSITIQYLSGGTDGDLSDEKFEEQYRALLNYSLLPELKDTARYPVTHLYDVGYGLDTKYAMIQFMATQKMCKAELACQDCNDDLYTMAESLSVGNALKTRAAMTPESEVFGTQALRAEIFGQAGYLTNTNINQIVPMTFWIAGKRASLHNATYIKGDPKGYPNSLVDIYLEHNWVPADPDQKQMCWDACVNYFQYANMVDLFVPDVRTIYKYTSSVLSDMTFTDACIYLMYIVQKIWAKYAGVTLPAAHLFNSIKTDIEKAAFVAFDGKYQITATPYQTADEVQQGDIIHISTVIVGYSPSRRWVNDIICKRENLISATTTA